MAIEPLELQFRSLKDYTWRIVLTNKTRESFSPAHANIKLAADPISWEEDGKDNMQCCIRGASGYLSLIVDGESLTRSDLDYYFNAQDPTDISIKVYKNVSVNQQGNISSELFFQGYFKTGMPDVPLEPYPFEVKFPIQDCLAAANDYYPTTLMDKSSAQEYVFTFKNLLEWWAADLNVDINAVRCLCSPFGEEVNDINVGDVFVNSFISIEENIDNTPEFAVKPKSYGEIMKSMLGTTNIYLRGRMVFVMHPRFGPLSASETLIWQEYRMSAGTLVLNTQHGQTAPRTLPTGMFHGMDHQTTILAQKAYVVNRQITPYKLDLSIDEDKNDDIIPIIHGTWKTLGQGNLEVNVGCNIAKDIIDPNINEQSLSVTWDNPDSYIYIAQAPETKTHIATLRSLEPVPYNQSLTGTLRLEGKLITRVQKDGMWVAATDYDGVLYYALKWGDQWYRGGLWSDYKRINNIKMERKWDGSDSENFCDPKYDPVYDNESTRGRYHDSVSQRVENYKGLYIPAFPQKNGAGYIELHLYSSTDAETLVKGLCLKNVTDNMVDRSWTEGKDPDAEGLEQPSYGVLLPRVFKANGNSPTLMHHLMHLNDFSSYYPHLLIGPFLFDGSYRIPMTAGFNPWDEHLSITL